MLRTTPAVRRSDGYPGQTPSVGDQNHQRVSERPEEGGDVGVRGNGSIASVKNEEAKGDHRRLGRPCPKTCNIKGPGSGPTN